MRVESRPTPVLSDAEGNYDSRLTPFLLLGPLFAAEQQRNRPRVDFLRDEG
jgi:hypothetical protein